MSTLEERLNEMTEKANETAEEVVKTTPPAKKKKTKTVQKVIEVEVEDDENEEVETEEVEEETTKNTSSKKNSSSKKKEEEQQPQPLSIKAHRGDDEFISETFSSLMESADFDEKIKKENTSVSSILSNITVDLNNIEIDNDIDKLSLANIENSILNDKTTMMVTCCQSSYTAQLSALRSQEIQSLVNSNIDYYSYKKRLFQIIHKHIETTSVGKIDYGKWLHSTSYFDIDTLLYGLYCQTFNYENKYTITCNNPKCGQNFDIITNNNTIVEFRDKEIFEKIDEIVRSVKNADELLSKSQVHKTKRIMLKESKIIFDIRIPSAFDYLEEVVAKNDDDTIEEYQNALGIALFVSNIYIPNIILLEKTGTLKYIPLDMSKDHFIRTISNLSIYDSNQLSNEINNFVEKYRVTYSIRNTICPHCGKEIKTIPLDMEDMLFYTTRRVQNEE